MGSAFGSIEGGRESSRPRGFSPPTLNFKGCEAKEVGRVSSRARGFSPPLVHVSFRGCEARRGESSRARGISPYSEYISSCKLGVFRPRIILDFGCEWAI